MVKTNSSSKSSTIHFNIVHICIAVLLWLILFVLVVFVFIKTYSTSAELKNLEKIGNKNLMRNDDNQKKQSKILNNLNLSINEVENRLNHHNKTLQNHNSSIIELKLENEKQNKDVYDLRNKSKHLNNQLNKSIHDHAKENLHHIESARQINNTMHIIMRENAEQTNFSNVLMDHLRHLEDRQDISENENNLNSLNQNQTLLQLHNNLEALKVRLNTSFTYLNSKTPEIENNLIQVNEEISGLITAINHCQASTCVHGVCQVHANNYTCHCDANYMGRNCSERRCKVGWKFHGDYCYNFVRNERRDWVRAEGECRNGGGHLASITNNEENLFMKGNIRKSSWIGLNDRFRENIYRWSDRSQYRHSDWAPGEPGDTNGEEDCVFMWKKRGYRWNDDRCSNLKPYVCKTRAKGL